MPEEIRTEVQEAVESEIIPTDAVVVAQQASMEFRLINPTEKGFLQRIEWNKEELEEAIKGKVANYENVVYTEDNMKQAKADRAELNKLAKAIDERRKKVKEIVNKPYEAFEKEVKEVVALIQEPIQIIDKQVKSFEEQQKAEKKKAIKATYDESIGELAEVLSFEKVFDNRYLNQTFKLTTAQEDVKAKIEKVRRDLETIDGLDSKFKLNAKDVYIKDLDLSKALAENKRLADLEQKLEAEKRRKEAEEAERKRLLEERRKEEERKAEERAKAEKERKEQEAKRREQQAVAQQMENVSIPAKSVSKEYESVSEVSKSVSNAAESVTKQIAIAGNTEGTKKEDFDTAVDPFAPKQAKQEAPKKFRTKFCAVGTRAQLEKLIQFMNENGIEYGRI